MIEVEKGKNKMDDLSWIVTMANESGVCMPKVILFCNTYNEIAALLAYLLKALYEYAYKPGEVKFPANRIVAIYHSMTLKKYKDLVVDSGNARIPTASSALRMGENFPNVRYVVHRIHKQGVLIGMVHSPTIL